MSRTSAKVRATKSRWNFSQRTHPIHPHSSLNSCLGAFRTIWVHLGPFGCITKLGTKWAELGQKFVPQSRVRMVHNERTQSTSFGPKLMFWRVSYHLGHLGPFDCLKKFGRKWAELGQKFVPRSPFGMFRNERTRPTLSDPKMKFWCI